MKKLLFSFVVLLGVLATAQVGVNTDQPEGTLDAAYINPQDAAKGTKWANPETPQGVHFPNVSTEQRSKFKNVREGMIIYNTNKKCLEMYLVPESGAPQWECILNVGSKASQGIAVSPESSSGRFAEGVSFTEENTVKFTITNNGFTPITNVDFSNAVTVENEGGNITVDGTANSSVSLKEGESKTLTYTLSGTPKAGKLTARFNKSGLSAEQVLTVGKGIADLQNQEYYVVSLTYNNINKQGYIDNASNQIILEIPYTNGKGSYDAVNIAPNIAEGQDGDTNNISLSIPAGEFSQTGVLTATLKVEREGDDESYKVKLMKAEEIYVIATYDIDINGSKSTVIIKGTGGVPDRNFDKKTNKEYRHQFVYLPVTVTGAGGYNKTWLNYNLGADYANIDDRNNFKPNQQLFGTAAHNDAKTYGSYYQWQRASDGHEFRNSNLVSELARSWRDAGKAAGNFIRINTSHYNWVANGLNALDPDLQLWQAGRANNPCPSGYHVPTVQEWQQFHQAVGSNNKMWSQDQLPNLAAAGFRGNGEPSGGTGGNYWSSTKESGRNAKTSAKNMSFTDKTSNPNGNIGRAYGISVRCIKSN